MARRVVRGLLIVAAGVGLVGCDDGSIKILETELRVPTSLAFGTVAVAPDPVVRTGQIVNSGEAEISIHTARLGDAGPFRFSLGGSDPVRRMEGLQLAAGDSFDLVVEFLPMGPGQFSDVLVLDTTVDGNSIFHIQLRGIATDKIVCGDNPPSPSCRGPHLVTYVRGPCPGREGSGYREELVNCPTGCDPVRAACNGCGDGTIDEGEVCDGEDLGKATCASETGGTGTMACRSDCMGFDLTGCSVCGNGIAELEEACDGADVHGARCPNQGQVTCASDCSAILRDQCHTCGNGVIEGPETCDGSTFGEQTCATTAGLASGDLRCNSDCLGIDSSGCYTCGNDAIEGPEVCDGTNHGGATCQTETAMTSGALACSSSCLGFETESCYECGDGRITGPEVCDGRNLGSPARTCQQEASLPDGVLACSSTCVSFDTADCHECGNNRIEGPEVCDGANHGTNTCLSRTGLNDGRLTCRASCEAFDQSGCYECGNGTIEGPEVCDGTNLGGGTCSSRANLPHGDLGCSISCRSFDTQRCHDCGNGTIEGPEVCDGSVFGGLTCSSTSSFTTGTLACGSTCRTIDPQGCYTCGNGTIEGAEICDGTNLGARTCQTEASRPDGSLSCRSTCLGLDQSDCHHCGNGTIEGPEICDGTNLGARTCRTETGLRAGDLRCDALTCRSVSTGNCHQCGNGTGEGPELCDGSDFRGQTCASQTNLSDGNLGCSLTCDSIDSTACHRCGNGIIEGPEVCDGTDFGSATCRSRTGLGQGTLGCNTTCSTIDGSGCHQCGNGMREGPEACDGSDLGGQTCTDRGRPGGNLSCTSGCAFDLTFCSRCGDGVCQSSLGETPANCPAECAWDWLLPVTVGLDNYFTRSVGGRNVPVLSTICGVRADGRLYCAGSSQFGQVGNGSTTECSYTSPCLVQVPSSAGSVRSLEGGAWHVCAAMSSGQVYCWGSNRDGQLGDGTTQDRSVPVRAGTLSDAVQVGAGGWSYYCTSGRYPCYYSYVGPFSCALRSNGTVACWGDNAYGQLGDGTTTDRTAPVQVTGLSGVQELAVGANHACARLSSGAVRCWGDDSLGQLGDGTPWRASSTPVTVSNLSSVISIEAGTWHTCALVQGGQVRCWGSGTSGELGNGQVQNANVPVTVTNISGAVQVEAGARFSCARLSSGGVGCWGDNRSSMLGNGGTTNSSTPVSPGLTGVTDIRASEYSAAACADRGTHGWYCWGRSLGTSSGTPQSFGH